MGDREKTDSAVIYFNIREQVFLVVMQAKRQIGGRAEIGEPVRVLDAEFESRIADVLLLALDSFQTNSYSDERARRSSDDEYRVFRKRHLSVAVERRPSGDVIVIPLHHSKGGYAGGHDEQIVVPKKDVPAKIPSALREAFSLAT